MELRVLDSATSLAFEIVANDQDGMRVELQTVGEAARFISTQFSECAEAVDCKPAAAALEAAAQDSTLVQQATDAVRNLLETEGMLSD